jgi:hypothetical protein
MSRRYTSSPPWRLKGVAGQLYLFTFTPPIIKSRENLFSSRDVTCGQTHRGSYWTTFATFIGQRDKKIKTTMGHV